MLQPQSRLETETIFEYLQRTSDEKIFESRWHEILILPAFPPRMRSEVVVAPFKGKKGEVVHFNDLSDKVALKLLASAKFIGQSILRTCSPDERVITHLEGFGVPDHAHIVVAKGVRSESKMMYEPQTLGQEAYAATLEGLTFTSTQTDDLNSVLDQIDYGFSTHTKA